MRDLSEPIDNLDLIDMMYRRAETTVDAEYGVVDDDREGEEIEHVGEILPDGGCAVFSGTFKVESVCL